MFSILFTFTHASAAPTAQEIELFKSLPAAQQQALIEQQTSGQTSSTPSSAPAPFTDTVKPLPTENKPSENKAVEETVEVAIANEPALARFQGLSAPRNQLATTRLERFGAGLFAGQPTTFAPTNDAPVPLDYLLGPGDQIIIQLFGSRNERFQLTIDRSGFATIPRVGTVNLSGLTFEQAKQVLEKRLETLGVGIDPVITMGEMRSFRVFVMGEARMPGGYMVSGMASITHALYISGGISNIGSFRNIELRRQGELVASLDLYDLLTKGDNSSDIRLQPGDTVFIPVQGKQISLMGEVHRPAVYEVKNEKSFQDMVKLAGGLTSKAYAENTKVTRIQDNGFATVLGLNLNKSSDLKSSFQNGDLVKVPGLVDELDSVVSLIGEVQRPGVYPWFNGMVLQDILPNVRTFKRDADLGYLVILRQENPGDNYHVVTQSWSSNNRTNLKAGDRVFVFSNMSEEARADLLRQVTGYLDEQKTASEPAQIASIAGNVRFAGRYPIEQGMSLHDLVLASGGLLAKTDENYILVRHEHPRTGHLSFSRYKYAELNNVKIKPYDKVYLFDLEQQNRAALLAADITVLNRQSSQNKLPAVASISGMVRHNGTFPVPENSTVAYLLDASGGLRQKIDEDYILVRSEEPRTGMLSFNRYRLTELDQVALKPKDKVYVFDVESMNRSELLAGDIEKLMTQSSQNNPPPIATVSGLVRNAGTFPLSASSRISDLIELAGGLSINAVSTEADLIRTRIINGEERTTEVETINLSAVMAGDTRANLLVEPGDQVIIKRVANWEDSARSILVEGEVRFPGRYTIEPGETLETILVRAGGFTQWAAPNNAVFLRENLKAQEKRELEAAADELEKNLLLSVKADAGFYTTDPGSILQMGNALVERMRQSPALGRLVIGLDPANERRYRSTMQMTLLDGDRLVIPPRPTEIVVTGEVLRSVSFIYQADMSINDYIRQAGGISKRADKKSIFIVQGDGTIEHYSMGLFSSFNNIKLQPGATIVVPMDVERVNPLLKWNSVAKILANFAVTAATLKTLGVIN
ncbi:SLBB domain-containing protein [Thiomicrospira microaerophila]|uniref:SLBB domain-containing protein n=1 Tax=Thiomicrospira microaerophila TaxID=406020 RepID=UPI0018E0AF73|nr:SLBB domain-containing protein [Thiomicrospira microaerophila]